MKYREAADYLTSFQQRRPKLGIDTTARMLAHFDDPHLDVDCVQIAGSNGKGSTARMLDSVLRRAGVSVGLFTSPGLNDFREQVRVDGRQVPKSNVAEYTEEIGPCIDRLRADDDEPTHFEVLTAVALRHFSEMDVDVAVLEVGIGGRYDATSAVDPVASAVTSVSLEHTELLGETVEEIATDKAQVAPADRPLVTGAAGDALEAIRGVSDAVSVGPSESDPDVVATETGMHSKVESTVTVEGSDWSVEAKLPLLGSHQATNAGVAAALARQLTDVDAATIAEGLRAVTWPGRFEVMSTDPMTVLDGSHNPGATATLSDLLGRYDYEDLYLVFGAMADKDYDAMVDSLPEVDTAYAAQPKVGRAESAETLAEALEAQTESVEVAPSVPEATEKAIDAADPSDFVLITGSLYTVAEARDRWARTVVPVSQTPETHADAAFVDADFQSETETTGTVRNASTTSREHADRRLFRTLLRPRQASVVADRLAEIGGECHRSRAGSPEKLVATVLAGTSAQFRELASTLDGEGHGLRRVAAQLRDRLAPVSAPEGSGLEAIAADRTAVMGILNVTPDSFHDGGEYEAFEAAVEQAAALVDEGADILDVGGESTRPGAEPVPVDTEIDRVVPVVEAVADLGVPISVDTRKAAVADAALEAGADIINDVSGLGDPAMPYVVAEHDASLVLMHSLTVPVDPDQDPIYDDVVNDVVGELREQVLRAERAGIDGEQIVVDPGCGFGKSPTESHALIDRLTELRGLGCPVLIGHSRKSMYKAADHADDDRLAPTVAGTALAADRGADVVRVHDVAENVAAIDAATGQLDPE
ncbi:MAG: dihydropteroate synthase [Halobellus sp.]|uniref:dihydropteroate synthase n=1 Tax=Halobellus sp. TaxID=1979212 RepID=UPI0035D4B167